MFNKKMPKIARNSWKNSTFAPKCLFSYIETGKNTQDLTVLA